MPADGLQWLAVGRVLGAFGVHGELKLEPWSPAGESVLNGARRWRLEWPAGPAPGPEKARLLAGLPFRIPAELEVASTRRQGSVIVARLREPLSREMADALKGVEVRVERTDFPAPAEDEFYHVDLIGCQAVNPAGEQLGRVVAVDDQGVQPLLRLEGGGLIPFVAAHVLEVRLGAGEILVDWGADWL